MEQHIISVFFWHEHWYKVLLSIVRTLHSCILCSCNLCSVGCASGVRGLLRNLIPYMELERNHPLKRKISSKLMHLLCLCVMTVDV